MSSVMLATRKAITNLLDADPVRHDKLIAANAATHTLFSVTRNANVMMFIAPRFISTELP